MWAHICPFHHSCPVHGCARVPPHGRPPVDPLEDSVTDKQPSRLDEWADGRDFRMSRAGLLRGAAGAMLAASPLLAAACGGGSSSGGTSPASGSSSGGTPVNGGQLRAG